MKASIYKQLSLNTHQERILTCSMTKIKIDSSNRRGGNDTDGPSLNTQKEKSTYPEKFPKIGDPT